MQIVCISDTHSLNQKHPKLQNLEGDLLIHAGDLTGKGELGWLMAATSWLRSFDFAHTVVIAGNHDLGLESNPDWAEGHLFDDMAYLNRTSCEVEGLKIYGTPWSPEFFNWAFNATQAQAKKHAEEIPEGIDILVTHGPPYGYGDLTEEGLRVGCKYLAKRILEIRPKLVVCGHIHESYGIHDMDGIPVVNASSLNRQYQPTNEPIVLEL